MQAPLNQRLFTSRQRVEDLLELQQGGLAAQLADHIPFGLGDHEGLTDGPAALGNDGPHAKRPVDQHRNGPFGEHAASENQSILPRGRAAARHPADHRNPAPILVELLQHEIGRKTVWLTQHDQRRAGGPWRQQLVRPTADDGPVRSPLKAQMHRDQADARKASQP